MTGDPFHFPDVLSPLSLAADSAAHSPVAETIHTVIGLLVLACGVGIFTKFIKVPYTIALVLVGLAIAVLGLAPPGAVITHDVVMLIFLPPLLFQAGLHLNLQHLRKVALPVLFMALPGVIVTMLFVAVAIRLLLPDGLEQVGADLAVRLGHPDNTDRALWIVALLFGIVMAPTDPISVMAVFKTAGVPERLKTIVEGESLFNDGTAVGIFAVLAATVSSALLGNGDPAAYSEQLAVLPIAMNFVRVALLGTVIGLAFGLIAFLILRIIHDHTLETAITVALAWGTFLFAEHFHASGVIAVVVAALIIGNYGRYLSMREDVVRTLHGFWDSTDFLINSLLFLMVGFELSDPAVGGWEKLIEPRVIITSFVVLGAVMAARGVLVYPLCLALGRTWPSGWKHIIWWSGLKGSLTIALLLILPEGSLRQYLIPVAFLVVLISLLIQGATMPLLIKALDIGEDEDESEDDSAAAAD